MPDAARYEIVDTIASGDFAVVYRARDRELGREVAIKQIHQQFLGDPRQLARYWQEAQLLASLQHPHILTIYDIVRPKGWLILELMRGNLQTAAQGEGIDLDFLRIALTDCLSALEFLHANGVIHGDVKPSNLLIDKQGRVKLGDFGLARRASDESGSLLKGTTKYMAPELLSDQFGAVGPASDLYSLGFTAYELMCGSQFESLFPGLGSYGRDKQIGWMMWHAAPDRVLPPVARVLADVPDDLARVIQHLTVKNQKRRCRSAKEALWELRTNPAAQAMPADPNAEADAAREAAYKRRRRMRFLAAGSMFVSLLLCAAMLFRPKEPLKKIVAPRAIHGVLTNVFPDESRLAYRTADKDEAKLIQLDANSRILINDKSHLLRELQPHDQIVIAKLREAVASPTGGTSTRAITEVRVFRPEITRGTVREVNADLGRLALTYDDGEKSKDLDVIVPQDLKITFNNGRQLAGKPVSLADLKPGDRVTVHHLGAENGRQATEIAAERLVKAEGTIVALKTDDKTKEMELTLNVGTDDKPTLLSLPLASDADCEVTINKLRIVNQQTLKPSDLHVGDKATVMHDSRVQKVSAYRVLSQSGVIQKVQYDANTKTIDVQPDGGGKTTTYIIGPQCKITFDGQPAELTDLRDGDTVEVTYDSLDVQSPEAISVAARRSSDSTRWAIIIGNQDYEDRTLGRLEYAAADAKLFRDTLVNRYKVPANQAILLTDESLVRLEQGIPEALNRIGEDGKLVVYVAAHAYKADDGGVYLAPKNFSFHRTSVSGLALQTLVDALEMCKAKEKLLLLDCSHAGGGADAAAEPSTAEMIRSLKAPPGRSPLRTVTAIASCDREQRGAEWPEKKHGLFAWLLAQGYSGVADKNRDGRIEPTELFDYLQDAMASAGQALKVTQTPKLFLPDDRPPRLSDEAKTAIRKLAAHLRQDRIKMKEVERDYSDATKAAGQEPEPKLLYGLILLKSKQSKQLDKAIQHFNGLQAQRPSAALLPLQAVAWARFCKRSYASGVEGLRELVSKMPASKKAGEPAAEATRQMFQWIGQLREYAALATESSYRPADSLLTSLDAAVAQHGDDLQRAYAEGRSKSAAVYNEFKQRIADATSESDAARLKVEQRQLTPRYAEFPYDQTATRILDGLDE
jgi:serine/threonine protein kinase